MYYTIEGRIRYSEIDHHGTVTLPGIINYFQDCSTFQSEDIGEGRAKLAKKKRAWILSYWQVIVDRYLDVESGRPVRPDQEEIDAYGEEPPLEMPYEGRKIVLPKETKDRPVFPVRKYHIDTNEHVNNCQYVQMALEVLPEEIQVHKLRVDYKKSAVLGDRIFPKYAKEEDRVVVELCDEGGKAYAVVEFA